MKLSGSEIIIQALKKEGVEYIFGYPGGAVLHIYDALFKEKNIKKNIIEKKILTKNFFKKVNLLLNLKCSNK